MLEMYADQTRLATCSCATRCTVGQGAVGDARCAVGQRAVNDGRPLADGLWATRGGPREAGL